MTIVCIDRVADLNRANANGINAWKWVRVCF